MFFRATGVDEAFASVELASQEEAAALVAWAAGKGISSRRSYRVVDFAPADFRRLLALVAAGNASGELYAPGFEQEKAA